MLKRCLMGSGAVALLLAMGVPSTGNAQPSLRGVTRLMDNGTPHLVVSGSGFGGREFNNANGAFLNAAWHNFEDGNLEGGNLRLEQKATYQWTVESSENKQGSRYHAQKVYVDNEGGELYLMQSGTTGVWFVSFWMRVKSAQDQQSGKFFRIWGDHSNAWIATGAGELAIRGYSEYSTCSPTPTTVWGSPNHFVGNRWHRVDIEMKETPDWFAVYLDGKLQWRRSSTLSGAEKQCWVVSPFNGNGHTLGLGGMLDAAWRNNNFGTRGSYKFDDIYVDYTLARVEVGDAPTWSDCRHKEIQIPRQWSNSQIVVDFNQGSFAAGERVYLYIVDSEGRVSQGLPMIVPIGDGVAPAPPTQMRIVR